MEKIFGIEDFIEKSNNTETVDELFSVYKTAMEAIGFDRIVFSLMTDHVFIKRAAKHGIVSNYPDDWMQFYVEKNYEVIDPVRSTVFSSFGPFTWRNMLETLPVTEAQKTFMNEGEAAGLYRGIGIPLRGPRGVLSGIGAASSCNDADLSNKNILSAANILSQQFYTVYLELEMRDRSDEEMPFIKLSDREREVLKWAAQGKTKSETAAILSISQHTVHSHIRSALKKLGANNITVGVLKALHLSLIQI